LRRVVLGILVASIAIFIVAAPASAASRRTYVQNFNNYPQGEWLEGSSISSWEVVYADQQCGGTYGCQDWWIGGYLKPTGGSQNGLEGGDQKGAITAHFTYPVTSISVTALAAYQFNAAYTLTAFGRRGRTVGHSTVVKNADEGLPAFSGFGYFPVSVSHLRAPACSFTFSAKWLAASNPMYTSAGYLVGTINVRLDNDWRGHRCP
jgi:hypothetical protein